jgi:hypothetical protein
MSRDEAAEICEQADGGMGTLQGWLGHDGATAMVFLEKFESSQRASVLTCSAGYCGADRDSCGERGCDTSEPRRLVSPTQAQEPRPRAIY